jgi:hypothetical protein
MRDPGNLEWAFYTVMLTAVAVAVGFQVRFYL